MKRVWPYMMFVVSVVLVMILIQINWKDDKSRLRNDFMKWENGELSEKEAYEVIENLVYYISRHPQISNELLGR